MKDTYITRYQRAYELYQAKKYWQVEDYLRSLWRNSSTKTINEMLLLSYAYREQEKYLSEIAVLEEMVRLFVHSNDKKRLASAYSLLGAAYRTLGRGKKAVQAFLSSAKNEPNVEQKLVETSNAIFSANSIASFKDGDFNELYKIYRRHLKKLDITPYEPKNYQHDKLRIGYLSADFREHPVAGYIRCLLNDFDSEKFSVYCYALDKTEDEVTEKLKGKAIWKNVSGSSHSEIASVIREDEIDILVDLGGHTAENALPVLAYRAALVQLSGIGYFNSTGLNECDGFLADVYTDPEETSPYFVEKLIRLPHSHFCYQPLTKFPKITDNIPAMRKGYVTFGSFNNLAKVTDEMLIVWREILNRVPKSELVLKHKLVRSAEGRSYMLDRLKSLNLPLDRIDLRAYSDNYLQEYNGIDIALDTAPYNGGATTCEALYMGVPVVSLIGGRHGSRFGYSFLSNINMQELAAKDLANYIEIAIKLANDYDLLAALRDKLRSIMQKSPLMDANGYVHDIENIYTNCYAQAVEKLGAE